MTTLNPNLNATTPPAPPFQAMHEGRLKDGIVKAFLSTAYLSIANLQTQCFTTEDGQDWTVYPTEALVYAIKNSQYPVKAIISFQVWTEEAEPEEGLRFKAVAKLFKRPNKLARMILSELEKN